ncbi:gene transfer agent family protein [Roseovarius indicus]|uniref:gene transfer agent family protein n=1 Tax=Roseovarius indicus TaxID=540747 RepID=UPI0032EFED5A
MVEVIAEWAGKERLFRLTLGGVFDLEEACGKEAIGSIFKRVSSGGFHANDLYHTVRIALIGGGMSSLEAKQLMETHFHRTPYIKNAELAGDILIALMSGVEEGRKVDGEDRDPEPLKFSEVSQICREFHMSPTELRAISYADFLNLVKGYNASAPRKAEPPTEEEFEAILARYEPEALK